jgi:hypothetical protein
MPPDVRRLRLRRDDRCVGCARELAAGELGCWDPRRREIHCLDCARALGDESVSQEPSPLSSDPGASARREYERRRDRRAERVRGRYGSLGGLVLWLTPEPRSERSWAAGAAGESKLAAKLERRTARAGVILLHDRRVPGTRANIDHIAIGPAGIVVIDAKRYSGQIRLQRRGGLFSARTEHLVVAGRDRTKLIDAVQRQVQVVRAALGAADGGVPVTGVLCFVDGQWPLFGAIKVREVPVVPPHALAQLCTARGPLESNRIIGLAERLAARLPSA